MIPKNIRPGATAEGLYGETVQFTIKANGKAFRALIDTLYSNKVLAIVRELCSNAHDSHIEAGQTKPFLVTIPTPLEPIFSVRDYGVGMSHEDVMYLYTRIFESTKEGTNEQTGQLGLGSKTPFAYTDSFSVISYTGTEKRIYLTYLATDGIPCITHVDTAPSDEPRGIEVSFAAKRESIPQFQKEMRFVSLGYDMPPTVTGMDMNLPQPQMSGTDWAIYPADEFEDDLSTHHWVRMGSALYPSSRSFPNLSDSFVSIVTIPIGMANITSSRDALAYDVETTGVIRNIHDLASAELIAQMEADVAQAKTRRGIAEAWLKYTGVLTNLAGKPMLSLRNADYTYDDDDGTDTNAPGWSRDQPGDTLQKAQFYGKPQSARRTYGRYISALNVSVVPKMVLIVDDQFNKCVRRKQRIAHFATYTHAESWVFTAYNQRQLDLGLAWLLECLELEDRQVYMVNDLTDVPPVRKPSTRADGTPRPKGPRRLGPNQFWMHRSEGRISSEIYGLSERGTGQWPYRMARAMDTAGLRPAWDDVLFVNDKQYDAMRRRKGNLLPKARRLDVAVERTIASKAKRAPLTQAVEFMAIKNRLRYNGQMDLVLDMFFPHVKVTESQAELAIELARSAKIDLPSDGVDDRVREQLADLTKQYPLLFDQQGREHYEQYIHAINLKEAANS